MYKDIHIKLLINVNTDNRCMYKPVCKIHAKIIVTSILNISDEKFESKKFSLTHWTKYIDIKDEHCEYVLKF